MSRRNKLKELLNLLDNSDDSDEDPQSNKKRIIYSDSDSEDESQIKRRRIRLISDSSSDEIQENEQEEEEDILKLVGEPCPSENSMELNPKLAKLWGDLMSKGLNEESKKKIIEKIPTVKNCFLKSPKLNKEILSTLNNSSKIREQKITKKQDQIGLIIANLNKSLKSLIDKKDQENINIVSDSIRLLCDLQYLESQTKRAIILPGLNKNLKEALENTEITENLFGTELNQVIKSSKDLERTSKDLRRPLTNKTLNYWSPSTSTQYPPPPGGQQGGYLKKIRAAQKKFYRPQATSHSARAPAAAHWNNTRAPRGRRPAQQSYRKN